MKKTKLFTSLAAFVLVLGLGACNQPEEEETSSDESGSTSQTTEGGTTEGGSGNDEGTTYKLGVLNENLYTYYYFDGTIDSGRFANGTATYDDAVALTLDEAEEGITLSWEADGKTYYLGYGLNESSQNCVIISEEVSYLKLNTTYNSIEDPEGKYFLGTYNEFTTMSWCGISYYDQDYIAHLYTEAQTNPTKPADPEPSGEMTSVETGKLGLYQGNLGGYYYFTGTINDSNFGVLSADYSQAVDVTLWKDDAYYYLTIGENESLKYIACADTTKSAISLSDNPYCLQYNSDYDAYLTGDGKEFLATYNTYTTLSWADTDKYLGDEGEFIAHLYKEEQKLPAPTEITISGPTSVYVGSTITLSANVEKGYDSSIVWSDDESGHASVDASGVVTGNSVGETVVTATSAVDPNVSASITITVEGVPEGLIGSFDFSSSEKNGTAISDSADLDEFWKGDEDIYLGIRQYSSAYLGNGSGGAFPDVTTLLKVGTASGAGSIQLKFALGTCINKVVVTAHSWNTSTNNALTVNGTSENTTNSGTAAEITYEIDDDLTYLVTMETSAAVTIHSIDIYGTYESEKVEPITSLSINLDETTLNVGDTVNATVSYEPETTIFDIDTLEWTSNDESVTVTQTLSGADIHAVAKGNATITAKANDSVSATIDITVEDVLQDTEEFVFKDLFGGNTSKAIGTLTGHQIEMVFAQGSHTNSEPQWYDNGNAVRLYAGNTITFTSLYSEATITSIVVQEASSNSGTFTGTNCTSVWDSVAYTNTITPTSDAVDQDGNQTFSVTVDANQRFTTIVVYYDLAA